MFQEFLAESRHLIWPLVALVLFFVVFVGVLVYVARGIIRHKSYDDVASLPLDEDGSRSKKGGVL